MMCIKQTLSFQTSMILNRLRIQQF